MLGSSLCVQQRHCFAGESKPDTRPAPSAGKRRRASILAGLFSGLPRSGQVPRATSQRVSSVGTARFARSRASCGDAAAGLAISSLKLEDDPCFGRGSLGDVESNDPLYSSRHDVRIVTPSQYSFPCVLKTATGGGMTELRNEIKVYAFLRTQCCVNVCESFKAWETPTRACLLLKFYGKGSVHDYFCQKSRSTNSLQMLVQMAQATTGLHRAGVAHMDISMCNFVRCDGRRVVLIDFEMSVIVAECEARAPLAYRGKYGSIAPELFDTELQSLARGREGGPRAYDPRAADVYSFGAMVLFLFVGEAAAFKHVAGLQRGYAYINGAHVAFLLGEIGLAGFVPFLKQVMHRNWWERPSMSDVHLYLADLLRMY